MDVDLRFVDLVADSPDPWNASDLALLVDLLGECFPGHPHVAPELRANGKERALRGTRSVHQILATVDGLPAGFIVIHANLARQIGLIHFLGIARDFRGRRFGDHTLATHLVRRGVTTILLDGDRAQRPLIHGIVAESEPELVPVWRRWGFAPMGIDYAEPYHGMHWAQHGEADFFEMTLVRQSHPTATVTDADAEVAAVCAFSLDHYLLPADHPRIAPHLRHSRGD